MKMKSEWKFYFAKREISKYFGRPVVHKKGKVFNVIREMVRMKTDHDGRATWRSY